MKLEKIEAGAGTGPVVLLGGERGHYTTNRTKSQRATIPPMPANGSGISDTEWCESLVPKLFKSLRLVGGELGPIGLLGSPRVCFGVGDCWTAVWVGRLPPGWSDPYRLFLAPNGKEAKAYALRLAEAIRTAAFNEEARREKLKAAYLREKFGGGL